MAGTISEIIVSEKGKMRLLLQLIYNNADVIHLRKHGVSYHNISDLISEAIRLALVEIKEERLEVTKEGIKFLKDKEIFGIHSDAIWISALESSKIPKIDKMEVYIPTKKVVRKLNK